MRGLTRVKAARRGLTRVKAARRGLTWEHDTRALSTGCGIAAQAFQYQTSHSSIGFAQGARRGLTWVKAARRERGIPRRGGGGGEGARERGGGEEGGWLRGPGVAAYGSSVPGIA
eukprot:2278434-Rhodomonas_salina.2